MYVYAAMHAYQFIERGQHDHHEPNLMVIDVELGRIIGKLHSNCQVGRMVLVVGTNQIWFAYIHC